jgi:hypothetical protein
VPRLTVVLLATLVLAALLTTPASAAVPRHWVGAMVDGPMFSPRVNLDREVGLMSRTGVRSIRVAFYWSQMQPYRTWDEIPPAERSRFRHSMAGIPTDFRRTDRAVRAAARRGLTVLPVVVVAPVWAARHPETQRTSPPAGTEQYAGFTAALVRRYGPRGQFWRANPGVRKVPIRDWQIWNEPNQSRYYWSDQPYHDDYVALLRAARASIKFVDPKARIVAAGLVGRSWEEVDKLYRAGARGAFDVLAIHPYTANPSNVVRIVSLVRGVTRRHGDGNRPIMLTELTWPSSVGRVPARFGWETNRARQASRLGALLPRLARGRRRLKIDRVYWYTWMGEDRSRTNPFDYSGLRTASTSGRLRSKPAYRTFRTTVARLHGCRPGRCSPPRR